MPESQLYYNNGLFTAFMAILGCILFFICNGQKGVQQREREYFASLM